MKTLLIVDDSPLERAVLSNLFENQFDIVALENGLEAVEFIEGNPANDNIAAILLDVVMPKMDGIAVLERLSLLNILSQIPVFLITGETNHSTVRYAYEKGVMDVIHKPITPFIVTRRINSVIELFEARKALSSKIKIQESTIFQQKNLINKLNVGLIQSLATAIEFRSLESGQHIHRIYGLTKLMFAHSPLAKRFSPDDIENIAIASIMHDVGKIAIPDSILHKPGKLTREEFDIMKQHTVNGEKLLHQIPQIQETPFFHYSRDIALYHHERWDGKGYPKGLKENSTPIWAQVVAIADVYDALVNDRVYKKAYDHATALQMMRDGECGKFNPDLLGYFLAIEEPVLKLYDKES